MNDIRRITSGNLELAFDQGGHGDSTPVSDPAHNRCDGTSLLIYNNQSDGYRAHCVRLKRPAVIPRRQVEVIKSQQLSPEDEAKVLGGMLAKLYKEDL